MKIFEVLSHDLINEGGDASPTQYNSEVGLLYGLAGNPEAGFDPQNPAASFNANEIANSQSTYDKIVGQANKYSQALFNQWAAKGPKVKELIAEKQGGFPPVTWVGGGSGRRDGHSEIADIQFPGNQITGISVKDKGGITLKNPQLAEVVSGYIKLDKNDRRDIFDEYAEEEYKKWKLSVFQSALSNAIKAPIVTPGGSIEFDPKTKKYTCIGNGGKTFVGTADQILGLIGKNAPWQRPFGDYNKKYWKELKQYAIPMSKKVAVGLVEKIREKIEDSSQLKNLLQIREKPYYYCNPYELYYVPSLEEIGDLRLKSIESAEPDGPNLKFIIGMGRPDSNDIATAEVHIRYKNGTFVDDPVPTIQSLRNMQFIGWELLGDLPNSGGGPREPRAAMTAKELEAHRQANLAHVQQAQQTLSGEEQFTKLMANPSSPIYQLWNKVRAQDPESLPDVRTEIIDAFAAGKNELQVAQELQGWLTEQANLARLKQLLKYI